MRSRLLILSLALLLAPPLAAEPALTPMQSLGKQIFFDPSLSEPAGQACASCHAPDVGFTSPDSARNAAGAVVPGARRGRAGNRTPPSLAYAMFSPILHWDPRDGSYSGGQFRDGRAADLTAQAAGPLLNPLEMNNKDAVTVCRKVARAAYADLFRQLFAEPLACNGTGFARIQQVLALYESSIEVNPFSSKYYAALTGRATLSDQELRGLALFRGPARCERCHPSLPGPRGEPPLFTDFGYDNVGTPKNPLNPFYRLPRRFNPMGADYVDPGLGGVLAKPSELGKFKTPTLRNVAAGAPGFVRAYMHNGALKGLKQVMQFYNRRDQQPQRWVPEQPVTINRREMGNLGLTDQDEDDIIAFLATLSDGWQDLHRQFVDAQDGRQHAGQHARHQQAEQQGDDWCQQRHQPVQPLRGLQIEHVGQFQGHVAQPPGFLADLAELRHQGRP